MTAFDFKILPDSAGEKLPSRLIPKACFTTDDQSEFSCESYRASDGSVGAGIWECAPCKMDIESYPVNEKMTIISGRLVLTHDNGREEVFGPGEVLFVAKGAKFTWHITDYLSKFYMTSA